MYIDIVNIIASIIMITALSILTIQEVIRIAKDFIKRKNELKDGDIDEKT